MPVSKTQTAIEALLQFALHNELIQPPDIVQVRNQLFHWLQIAPEDVDESIFNQSDARAENPTATAILTDLSDDYAARGFMPVDTVTVRDLLETAVMGLCMPRASEVVRAFSAKCVQSPVEATDYFYRLCRAANYIQVDRVGKNLFWRAPTDYGDMEITVNLSKPEKDPRDIAAARHAVQTAYPRCLLCLENVGFAGTLTHPARQNLRVIPVTLHNEPWYFQYSPYLYYHEHCIVFNERHTPMRINESTFIKLIDFITQFPHYFIGSNADLPIVGGSILSHDHFQGGRYVFPMDRAACYAQYRHTDFPAIVLSSVKWPMTVLRLTAAIETGMTPETANARAVAPMTALAVHILETWRGYSEPEAEVLAYSGATPHNTITPIVRHNAQGLLEMDLVLRNNRTTETYPLGIFHPHAQWHHIKKENIGLIEVMGLAILPGRLRAALHHIARLLSAESPADTRDRAEAGVTSTDAAFFAGTDDEASTAEATALHEAWTADLLARYGRANTPAQAVAILQREVGIVFTHVLDDCGVFKDTDAGRAQLCKFITALGFTAR